MLVKDFASIQVNGRCFDESTLLVFPHDGHRLSFVFGANGSGKSSLSRAFAIKRDGGLPEGIEQFNLLDKQGKVLGDESAVLEATYVYNEAFIEEKVRVVDSGLGSIVMLGDAGDLAERITEATQEKASLASTLHEKETELETFEDPNSDRSPKYHKQAIGDALTGAGKWNDRDKRIKNNKRNTSVNENAIHTIEQLSFENINIEKYANELEEGINRVALLSKGESLPDIPRIPASVLAFDEEVIVEGLAKEVQEPVLSDREKRLLEVAQRVGTHRLSESRTYFSQNRATYCPYCFRDMSDGEIDSLLVSVKLVLNEEANRHEAELNSLLVSVPTLVLDLEPFEHLDHDLVKECEELIKKIGLLAERYRSLIDEKLGNLYTPEKMDPLGYTDQLRALQIKLEALENKRLEWNEGIKTKKELVNKLQRQNNLLARVEIDAHLKKRSAAEQNKANLVNEIDGLKQQLHQQEQLIASLESAKSNIKVALDKINSALAFIFLDKDHLVLQGENGMYTLLSHGAPVKPKDVSTGERNAIALCYFFTLIGEGKNADQAYSDEVLLVLDDPISSFDQENRIGILSYLRQQFKDVLASNPYSKVLCFTHDGFAMNAFDRMRLELCNYLKGVSVPFKNPGLYMLSGSNLMDWKLTDMRYGEMLNTMYNYAASPDDQVRPYIGNLTRRALEAFSTFEFGMGVTEFADSEDVFSRIDSEVLRQYFRRLMFHAVLHSESHSGDPVSVEGLIETLPEYTSETVDKIIRDVVCLLYALNSSHVCTHLSESKQAEQNIKFWMQEIENQLVH